MKPKDINVWLGKINHGGFIINLKSTTSADYKYIDDTATSEWAETSLIWHM